MPSRSLPTEIVQWERRTGFDANNARAAFSANLPIKAAFERDIRVFVLWYTDMLLFGQKVATELNK